MAVGLPRIDVRAVQLLPITFADAPHAGSLMGREDGEPYAKLREQLERLVAAPGISKDVYEQASKSLG